MQFFKPNAMLLCFILLSVGGGTGCEVLTTNHSPVTEENSYATAVKVPAHVGLRPLYLVDQMRPSALKEKLAQCRHQPMYRSDFSIGHRGAAMQFPEHTKESYQAAIDSGAGIVECDVTFTKDKALVCRHSQCDLATTTNILTIPELASQCSIPFTPANPKKGTPAYAKCCTSDITVAQFKRLKGKMDGYNPQASNVTEFIAGTPDWRTDLYAATGTLMTHAQSIEMFKKAGVKMTPELKSPAVAMPFNGFTQQDYAYKMLDEYVKANIPVNDVFAQSFNVNDVIYWLNKLPQFGKQAVLLDGREQGEDFDPQDKTTFEAQMHLLQAQGVQYIAPPLWMLVTLDESNTIVPSAYAIAAKEAGLKIITWTLERSGLLNSGGGWYYQTINQAIEHEGDIFMLLDVLAKDIGVVGVFSDWPATVTYYANCQQIE